MYQPPLNSQWFTYCAIFCANSTSLLSKKYTFFWKKNREIKVVSLRFEEIFRLDFEVFTPVQDVSNGSHQQYQQNDGKDDGTSSAILVSDAQFPFPIFLSTICFHFPIRLALEFDVIVNQTFFVRGVPIEVACFTCNLCAFFFAFRVWCDFRSGLIFGQSRVAEGVKSSASLIFFWREKKLLVYNDYFLELMNYPLLFGSEILCPQILFSSNKSWIRIQETCKTSGYFW